MGVFEGSVKSPKTRSKLVENAVQTVLDGNCQAEKMGRSSMADF
jgi:hypothetical protein